MALVLLWLLLSLTRGEQSWILIIPLAICSDRLWEAACQYAALPKVTQIPGEGPLSLPQAPPGQQQEIGSKQGRALEGRGSSLCFRIKEELEAKDAQMLREPRLVTAEGQLLSCSGGPRPTELEPHCRSSPAPSEVLGGEEQATLG